MHERMQLLKSRPSPMTKYDAHDTIEPNAWNECLLEDP